MRKIIKPILCFALALTFVFSAVSGSFPAEYSVSASNVYCNVRFSKPAICCDVGDFVDLTKCGVQFSATSQMTLSGISWTYNGAAVSSFTPSAAGTYVLTAKQGSNTKNVYVVAKNATDTEYVLYYNDFDAVPSNFREIEKTGGAYTTTWDGVYVIDASSSANSSARILFPEFLDNFGDVKIQSTLRQTSGDDSSKRASILYRVQNKDYPYMQACMYSEIGRANGLEITEKTPDGGLNIISRGAVGNVNTYYYYDVSVDAQGTDTTIAINGTDMVKCSKTPYTVGAMGFQVNGVRLTIDYVKITIEGNSPATESQRISFAKPAIRAEMGDIIDLKACDVQLSADALYTKGSSITWKQNGNEISTFVPTASGVTTLTATCGGVTKNVYVVTKQENAGEYILYYNDFSTAPNDLRIPEKTGSTNVYYDGAAQTFVVDASGSASNYGTVVLPFFLDDFGDFKMEARIQETNSVNDSSWSSILYRAANSIPACPAMQFTTKYNASLGDGIVFSKINSDNGMEVITASSINWKNAGQYNVIGLSAQGNKSIGYVNGGTAVTLDSTELLAGSIGFRANGTKMTIDYIKVTLGDNSVYEDSTVKCAVSNALPAIGCDVGQLVLLDQCDVQMVYGAPTVKGSDIKWTYNGKVITEFEAPLGVSVLEAEYNDRKMTVWVVAKKTADSEYVLYYNDFSSADAANEIRVIEKTNGGNAYYSNGTYVLNASSSADTYARVLLPSKLSIFGDGEFTASVKLTGAVDESKWASMMYRVQKGNFPYMQGCLRYNAALGSGIEISQKMPSGAWNVLQSGSFSGLAKDNFNLWTIKNNAKSSQYILGGNVLLSQANVPYSNGDWGFQARGLTLNIDFVKLSFKENHTRATLYILPGNYADVRDVETGIKLAPAMVYEVKTKADLNGILDNSPAVAIMPYKVVNGVGQVVLADGTVSMDKAIDKLSATVIPAFRITDNASIDSLVSYLEQKDLRDVYVVSTNPSYVKTACEGWKHIRGVVDYSATSQSRSAEELRTEATANYARVLMLNNDYCTKENVTYIHDMFSCVWIVAGEGKSATVEAVNKGPYGIVTPNRAVTEACYVDYYLNNTLIRRSNVVGHRGVPTMAQENSLTGLKTALSNGATAVENDIQITSDGVLMIMHDTSIDRTTNGTGYIYNMTSAEISKYVIDYKSAYPTEAIPSLEDFFKYCKGDKSRRLVVEVKTANTAYATAFKNLIDKYDLAEQVVIISFGSTQLSSIRELMPGIPVSNLASEIALNEADPITSASNIISRIQGFRSVYSPEYYGLGYNTITECIYRGVSLWPWTVDSRSVFDDLWISSVGGITTNCCYYASNYVANLEVNSAGKVIATNYKGEKTDVTNAVEMVVVEDTLGISFANGVVNVPQKPTGGKATYFFRYKSQTGSGHQYYTVTELQTAEVKGSVTESFILKNNATISLEDGFVTKVTPSHTASQIKSQFAYSVAIVDANGNAIADNDAVPTGSLVYLVSDPSQKAYVVVKGDVNGDAAIDATDYLKIKAYFLMSSDLSGAYYAAADYNDDGSIAATDYIQLKANFLGWS